VSPLAASARIQTDLLTSELARDTDGYTTSTLSDERDSSENAVPTSEEIGQLNDEIALMSPFRQPQLTPRYDSTVEETDGDVVESHEKIGDEEKDRDVGETGKLIVEEERSEGRVGTHVFAAYYHAIGGFPIVSIILLSQVAWQGLQIGSDFWLSSWSNDAAKAADSNSDTDSTVYRLTIYSILGLLAAAMVLVRTLIITFYGMEAAKNLFNRMTDALLHAPMRFFDVNPIGRILTRYGGDVSAVDMQIPFMFGTLAANLFSVGCSAATAALVIQWKGLLLLPVVYLYVKLGGFYIQPARELQRLLQTTRAPILNHLSETIDGVSTVRAFGTHQVQRFWAESNAKLDGNHIVWYAQLCTSQWFTLRIQLLGSMLLLVVTSSLVLLRDMLDAAVIALAFSYALKVSTNLESIINVLTRIETVMVSPERMQQYIDIAQEAPHRVPSTDIVTSTEHWPSTGAIEFKHVTFRYKPNDPLVLNDVNFSAPGGDKIGIVGRTGAGKSSLTMALFRINELAGGAIIIDGVDISKLGLTTLREKLSIIPQVPVLFKGSLRSYLDPFEEFTDDQLWRSLEQVGLRERVASDELKLLLLVEENGENFSVGERQMLCMARALLRSSRIVVFDEATAAIDHETDQKLQRVIRSAFRESTVLTIAHRLDTILDSDRVLVLDGGRVAEFASPKELVARGEGHFFDLMREGGYLDRVELQS